MAAKYDQGDCETSQQCSHATTFHNPYSGCYGEIFSYLTTKNFPSGATECSKRMLKKSSLYYCVIDGVLHYGHKNPKRVVSEKEEQRKILASAHIEEGTGVHRGARKMYELINSTVFWRFLYVDITNYIKECMRCVDYSPNNHECLLDHDEPEKHDWPKSPHTWEKVFLQILGPYPKTSSRNEFVVTIVDPVSHWIVAQPIACDGSLASQVACLIFKTFCDFGFTKCIISSIPPQISSDILDKLAKYEDCVRKVTAALGVREVASQIGNMVICQDKAVECPWLSELFSTWVEDNPCTWDNDLDEFIFEFRALPKNGAPSPFRAMFNRRPVQWSEEDKENIQQQVPVPALPNRRKLQGSLMKCRHCDELFTSKMSFRIHQRKHTEEAKHRGLLEGEEPSRHADQENSEDGNDRDVRTWKRSSNQNTPDSATGNVVNVWKRLKKITNKGSHTRVGKPQLREEVQKQLRANAVAAVKNIILATKDVHKKRGKYQKYPQDIQDEMAHYAIQHGISKTTRCFTERLGTRVSHSTVRNIVKLHRSFTPQLKDEIGRFAAGFGVEAAARHFSERLGREVRQGLVRKFKKLYVDRFSDASGKADVSGHPTVPNKQKGIFDEKLKEEIGKHAFETGITSTVNYFLAKHSLRLKESLIRRLRKQYLERNKPLACDSVLPEMCQHKQNTNTDETPRPYHGTGNACYTDQMYQSAPYVQTNSHLLTQQNSTLHFNTVNNTINPTSLVSYQHVPSSTTSVIVNQDSISVPIFQQPEQIYSSVTNQGHVIHGSVIPVPTSLASVPHSHFHFQPPVVLNSTDTVSNSETALHSEHHFQQVPPSLSDVTTEASVAAVHVPLLPQKQQPPTDNSSSSHTVHPQAVVIHQSHHPNAIESPYPGTVVQTVSNKMTMLQTLDTGSANMMTDRDGTVTLATCVPTTEKSLYKPQTFHMPVSRIDTVAMAVCRDDSQTVNDVIITIVPSPENDETCCKDGTSYQNCQKNSNNTFLLEKDQQHLYKNQLNKQINVIPSQLQQRIIHFRERQAHKQQQHQEKQKKLQQQKHKLNEPQVINLQEALFQEQQDETVHKYKQQNSQQPQQQEQSHKLIYQQQQSQQLQKQLHQVQQSDSPSVHSYHQQQILLLQPHVSPHEQLQKQIDQQDQQHSQQIHHHLLQQPLQLQESQQESVQHLKKQHFHQPQQQLLLLPSHLTQDQLQKSVQQQTQLQFLQLQQQILKDQTKESIQQQKPKFHDQRQKLIQMQPLVSCEQSEQSVNQQKQQQLNQPQQPVLQIQLQFYQEQQKSAHEQHSQLFLTHEQTQELTQQIKQLDLHQSQHVMQQKLSEEKPQKTVHQNKLHQVHESQHRVSHLQQQLCLEQQCESTNQKTQLNLHQPKLQALQLHQQLIREDSQQLTHQEKQQHVLHSEHQVLQLQEKLVQKHEKNNEEQKQHSQQSESQVLELQVQEQVQNPINKEKQQLLDHSQHQILKPSQNLNQEQIQQQPVNEEKRHHLEQSQHQVVLLQQHLVQKQPQRSTHQEQEQHLLWPQQVPKFQQQFVQEEPLKSVPQEDKAQNLHQSEHQAFHLQQQLDQEKPQESGHQKHLPLPQRKKHNLGEEQSSKEKQQNLYHSEHRTHNQLAQEQQQTHQERQVVHQSHNEIRLQKQQAIKNVQEGTHQEKEQNLHQSNNKVFQQLSQEQLQASSHLEEQQQLQQQLLQPHQMLHLECESQGEHLKKQVGQQDLLHQQHLLNLQKQDNSKSHLYLHQKCVHSHPHKLKHLGEQFHQQQKSQQNSYQEQQSEVLHCMKLSYASEEEEEIIDDPDKMVIYVSDVTDNSHENAAKEQKKNSSSNARKEISRPKNKTSDNASHKRGNYMLYSPELRAELGKYAAEFGNQRAREYFKDILGHDVPESTIRSLRDKYILKCHLNSNTPGGVDGSVTSLGYSPRGRPLRLGKYDNVVRECIRELMKSGEKISKFLAIATAKQVLMQYEPELLVENGGSIKLTNAWAKSFLRRIGVQLDC